MKNTVINASMNLIRKSFPDYEEEKLECVQYGLEGVYLSLTKVIVIFTSAFFLGIFKEALILLLLFNILRVTAFGLHASKSWMCWISSSIIFLGCPLLCMYLKVPLLILVSIGIICLINFMLYAPADTEKRPLVNAKKRKVYKIITLISASIYILLLFFINNSFLQNILVCSMIIQSVLIHPLVYKLFKLPYDNYKSYVFSK